MIALQAISQKSYIIDNDTIVGYSKQENRKIAIIFLQGDSCKAVSIDNNAIVSNLNNTINSYKIIVKTDSIYKTNLEVENKTINNELVKYKDKLLKSDRAKQTWRIVAFVEAVTLTILILLNK